MREPFEGVRNRYDEVLSPKSKIRCQLPPPSR
jgi:hypothetical protein